LSRFSTARREQTHQSSETELDDGDVEKQAEEDDNDGFELSEFMREGHFEKRVDGRSTKRIGVTWKNLTVKGSGSTSTYTKTLPDAILGTFGPDLYRMITYFLPQFKLNRHAQLRTLIHDFTGIVRPGEMMLVLGKPGSGCSTFLKTIANQREGYADVSGEVSYGGIDATKQKRRFRGEVSYNPETDLHFATLNVWQTLKFSLMNKTKKREKGEIPIIVEALLKIFGITHTKYTLVGDETVRGVSGGERKRVSIAETLSTKSAITCWDNSTRGLDSSTALDYAKSLRIMTDISNRSTLVTLYQAGEGIYELMDKVMVIDAGRCIFLGSAREAKQYFIDLGYHCPDRQTTPDFLTALTDPVERKFREGFENSAPRGPVELEKAFKESEYYKRTLEDVQDYCRIQQESDFADTKEFTQSTQDQKSKTVTKKSSYTVSFIRQVYACMLREIWLIWGDKPTLYTKFFIIIANALIVGSLFYGQELDTSGAFSRGGTVFFGIIFLGWLQLSELMKAVSGRAVVARHKEYAFYRPSAVTIARAVVDFPFLFIQVTPFVIVMYFLTGLDLDVSKFWIFFLFVYTLTIVLTALYRMFAAISPSIDDAVRFAGTALNILFIYVGYLIPKQQLLGEKIWFGWLYREFCPIHPISRDRSRTDNFDRRKSIGLLL
jgi:ABC-type multidrug transport system ATPase subunit